jgi:hypothetical protein
MNVGWAGMGGLIMGTSMGDGNGRGAGEGDPDRLHSFIRIDE